MSATETLAALKEHLPLVHSGKARESFHVWKARSGTQGYRAIYPTDRISSDDFVLGFLMEGKGEILNAETVFWKLRAKITGLYTGTSCRPNFRKATGSKRPCSRRPQRQKKGMTNRLPSMSSSNATPASTRQPTALPAS